MTRDVRRRRFLATFGAGTVSLIAGCTGDGNPDDDGTTAEDGTPTTTADEDDAPGSDGLLYAFAPDRAVAIDPEAGDVEEDLTDELDPALADADWGDARLAGNDRMFLVDASENRLGAVDLGRRELLAWIDIGQGATHAFHPVEGEIWAHADDEGRFYVVDTEALEVAQVVQSGLEDAGHGKLLTHEDLRPKAFATNTNDSFGHVIDLERYERVDSLDVGEEGGTHYAMYAPKSGLVYFERSGGDDMPYFDAETHEAVGRLDENGGLSITPDREKLGIWTDDAVHFADATGRDGEILGSVDLEGRGPDDLSYFEEGGTLYAYTANTTSEEVSVVDVDDYTVETHVPAGAISQEGRFLHRSGALGGGYYFTTSGADGTVPVIDAAGRELLHEVDVGEGVDTIRYVGDATGAWY